jgi:hypothetical protein
MTSHGVVYVCIGSVKPLTWGEPLCEVSAEPAKEPYEGLTQWLWTSLPY